MARGCDIFVYVCSPAPFLATFPVRYSRRRRHVACCSPLLSEFPRFPCERVGISSFPSIFSVSFPLVIRPCGAKPPLFGLFFGAPEAPSGGPACRRHSPQPTQALLLRGAVRSWLEDSQSHLER